MKGSTYHVKDGINWPIEIDHCREPPVNKCNYNSDLEAKSDVHQTGATFHGSVGRNALSGSPVAAPGRGPPAVHDSLSPGTTAPPTPARILSSAREMPRNAPNALAGGTAPVHISCTLSPPNSIPNNQGHDIPSPPGVGCYHCITQHHTDGQARVRIGYRGYIPRWVKGSTVSYTIREESFEHPYFAIFTAAMVAEATSM